MMLLLYDCGNLHILRNFVNIYITAPWRGKHNILVKKTEEADLFSKNNF
jgi:hypothetical protein